MEQTTDFGYQQVSPEQKTKLVDSVFSSVAQKYDLMNDLMSFGIHRLWKKIAVQHCAIRPGQQILDLAGGTGDLSIAFCNALAGQGNVTIADLNHAMLRVGREKILNSGFTAVKYANANAESLPFPDNSFDCVAIGFGLRNVTDKSKALKEMYRTLKAGGRLVILEFSKPTNDIFSKIYDVYSFSVLPTLGKFIADDADSYQYLAESIRKHPDQETLLAMMQQVGFEDCSYHNLSAGICAVHKGFKY